MNPTAWQKLRVFAPQILAFASFNALLAVAIQCASSHEIISVEAGILAGGVGLFTMLTTVFKAVDIDHDGWEAHIPDAPRPCPNCASMAAEHAKLLADRDELRETLAILEIK